MNTWLRKLAVFIGLGLLFISIFWSQDGFNFSLAGSSGGGNFALYFGWFIAVSVCVIQFVFSTSFRELNPSLLLFGALAYVYSIYTNYQGIIHFQGLEPSPLGAGILSLFVDAVPEPLIAWGLYESMQGDLVGNLMKWAGNPPKQNQPSQRQPQSPQQREQRHNEIRNIPKPKQNPDYDREPTYYPINMQPKPKSNIPPFLMDRGE